MSNSDTLITSAKLYTDPMTGNKNICHTIVPGSVEIADIQLPRPMKISDFNRFLLSSIGYDWARSVFQKYRTVK